MDIIQQIMTDAGFTEYVHRDGYTVWSEKDLLETDHLKEWFLA
jgi:hypothetical protein